MGDIPEFESDIRIANNIDTFAKVKDKLRENLASIDMMKFELLADIDRNSDEADTIVKNMNVFRDATKQKALLEMEHMKSLIQKNPDAPIQDLLKEANTLAITGLSETHKAALYQQGSLTSAVNLAGRIAKGKQLGGDFHSADGWLEKADITKRLFFNNVGLITTAVAG